MSVTCIKVTGIQRDRRQIQFQLNLGQCHPLTLVRVQLNLTCVQNKPKDGVRSSSNVTVCCEILSEIYQPSNFLGSIVFFLC